MSRLGQFCPVLFHYLNQCYSSTAIRLLTLFSLALVLTWTLAQGEATAERLFQSPISPVEQEFIPEPPPAEPEVIPEPPPAEPEIIPEPPPAELEVIPEPPPEPAVEPPVEQPAVEPIPVEPQPDPAQPPPVDPGTFVSPVSSPPAPAQAGAPLLPEPASQRESREDRLIDDEAGEGSGLIVDRAEFVDTLVVSTAYIWLCCGIIIFLTIPLAFLFLQIRGRTKISRDNLY